MMDYEKLVKALRCKRDDCEGCDLAFFDKDEGWMCRYAAKDDDAADAIEVLEKQIDSIENDKTNLEADIINLEIALDKVNAQLPKRGKWIYKPKDAIEMMFTLPKCSVCGHESSDANNFCPNCGAKMETQDENISKFADGEWWKEAQK